ncbi:hypothetical protein FGB62_5g037 [Gracilaria domingensis]|nr:hypothetical protein FGB62_5g037 [Gracilaria domingensis]
MAKASLKELSTKLCFAPCVAHPFVTSFSGRSLCVSRPPNRPLNASRVRMDVQRAQSTEASQETLVWPPPGMTEEWAEAVQRLSKSIRGATLDDADAALQEADGDEDLALRYLTQSSMSEIKKKRERAVEEARLRGDGKRVDALREAQLRRKATGSAREFFKGFVDVEGSYVDSGYVDESSDAMGQLTNALKGFFGRGRK